MENKLSAETGGTGCSAQCHHWPFKALSSSASKNCNVPSILKPVPTGGKGFKNNLLLRKPESCHRDWQPLTQRSVPHARQCCLYSSAPHLDTLNLPGNRLTSSSGNHPNPLPRSWEETSTWGIRGETCSARQKECSQLYYEDGDLTPSKNGRCGYSECNRKWILLFCGAT